MKEDAGIRSAPGHRASCCASRQYAHLSTLSPSAARSPAQAREANEVAVEADRLADLARQLREKARQAQDAAKRLPGDVKARGSPWTLTLTA